MSCCHPSRYEKSSYEQKEIEPAGTLNLSNMVYIPSGSFLMGTNDADANPYDDETPVRKVHADSFYIDRYAVTNTEFEKFIEATGYVTDAERFGWSFVFHLFIDKHNVRFAKSRVAHTPWWIVVEGADWSHPEGPNSSISGREHHPVVHVSWNDAQAYAKWAGKKLPSEAEWEKAARGGLKQARYPWGNELAPNGEHHCNIWQGEFPVENTLDDGYLGTAPVDCYKPNHYGLYNMVGNVWEWCLDSFKQGYAMRGGSYLCHDSYCNRYRVSARTFNTNDSSAGNIGFRCVADGDCHST